MNTFSGRVFEVLEVKKPTFCLFLGSRDLILRQSKARQGEARRGKARRGEARRGKTRPGEARRGRCSSLSISRDLEGFAPVVRGSLPVASARGADRTPDRVPPFVGPFGSPLGGFGTTLEVVFGFHSSRIFDFS
jgi:hypothetical protein